MEEAGAEEAARTSAAAARQRPVLVAEMEEAAVALPEQEVEAARKQRQEPGLVDRHRR